MFTDREALVQLGKGRGLEPNGGGIADVGQNLVAFGLDLPTVSDLISRRRLAARAATLSAAIAPTILGLQVFQLARMAEMSARVLPSETFPMLPLTASMRFSPLMPTPGEAAIGIAHVMEGVGYLGVDRRYRCRIKAISAALAGSAEVRR